ncbi:MAG TPA: AAA family ATPase [Nevskiaceae bacterium]|nr:AAA family ATPase [Nevskiaceae bacterium]
MNTFTQRLAHNAPLTGALVPATILLALMARYELHTGVPPEAPLYWGYAAIMVSLALGLACLAMLTVQAMQRNMDRTMLVPALTLGYAAYAVSGMLAVPAWGHAMPVGAWHLDFLFHWLLPAVAVLTAVVAVVQGVRTRTLHTKSVGYGQVYTVAPGVLGVRGNGDQPAAAGMHTEGGAANQFPSVAPAMKFADLYGNDALKQSLREAGESWRNDGKNGVLMFGPPGGGKTAFAEALAGELGLGFMKVTLGDLASKWVNQSTEQLVRAFREARAQAPVLLFLDEIDSILTSRESGNRTDEYRRMVNVFLTEVVDLRGSEVLVVAATNFIDSLDAAATREGRFDFKVEVPLPDAAARRGLIASTVKKAGCSVDEDTMGRLVRRWAGFNVPRIIQCAEVACKISTANERHAVTYDDFYRALRKIQGRKGGAPEGAKRLDELFMDSDQSTKLHALAKRLTCVDDVERMGGSLPKGVLFYGPPGTGKTATAMALAAECGWSFITRTGRALLDNGAVKALGKEASDLRPAIVFVDEADDILGDRTTSPYKVVTNDLLALIDGAGGTLRDVVWIAATNHPDGMDAAAVRGGRFGQKVEFHVPKPETTRKILLSWVHDKLATGGVLIKGTPETWTEMVAAEVQGLAPADIYQVLDSANNAAIAAKLEYDTPRHVTRERIREARAEVNG